MPCSVAVRALLQDSEPASGLSLLHLIAKKGRSLRLAHETPCLQPMPWREVCISRPCPRPEDAPVATQCQRLCNYANQAQVNGTHGVLNCSRRSQARKLRIGQGEDESSSILHVCANLISHCSTAFLCTGGIFYIPKLLGIINLYLLRMQKRYSLFDFVQISGFLEISFENFTLWFNAVLLVYEWTIISLIFNVSTKATVFWGLLYLGSLKALLRCF